MSSPIYRPSDTDGISRYAPKWARDVDSLFRQHAAGQPRRVAGDSDVVAVVPADGPDADSFPSLAPIIMPEPPMPEPWLRDGARVFLRGGLGVAALIPFLFAVFLASLIALVIVAEWPNILSFLAKQLPTPSSFGAIFDDEPPRSSATPRTTAREPDFTSAARSDSAQPSRDPWIASINPAVAPIARPSPSMPTLPAIVTPALANPAPVASPPSANPTPAVASPLAAGLAPSAQPVPIQSVKTVAVEPERPIRPLGSEEIETLLKQGEDFVAIGDFVSARLVYGRVAEAHDARGALAFAATFDPIVLARIRAKGATPDVAKAREWYAKARDLGSPDAMARLGALANSAR